MVAPYEQGKVSLPHGQEAATDLIGLLEGEAREDLANFGSRMMPSEEALGEVYQENNLHDLCYHDPVLASDPVMWAGVVV